MTARPPAGVEWQDLRRLRRREIVHELTISAPWLLGSWWLAARGLWLPALGCSFMFFLTGLRQVHNAYHMALGLGRGATEWVMFVLSVVMLGSMHAVQVNHLRHHRHCLRSDDVEAMSARLPAWRALLVGPWFPLRLHHKALQVATPRQRRWIAAELGANGAAILLVFMLLPWDWLRYHVLAMAAGQCLTAFFAVWTVHHGCDADGTGPIARTIRGRLRGFVSYDMFYHLEHHLFPAVPTRKLALLAQRLDRAAPQIASRRVF